MTEWDVVEWGIILYLLAGPLFGHLFYDRGYFWAYQRFQFVLNVGLGAALIFLGFVTGDSNKAVFGVMALLIGFAIADMNEPSGGIYRIPNGELVALFFGAFRPFGSLLAGMLNLTLQYPLLILGGLLLLGSALR